MMLVINAAAVGQPAVRRHEELAGSTLQATSHRCGRMCVVVWQIKPTLH